MPDVRLVEDAGRALCRLAAKLIGRRRWLFPGSSAYWEERYAAGGTSGAGSYGQLALYKAGVVNQFTVENQVSSVIEFGCGDGNQLSYAKYPQYTGLDVARTAVANCIRMFKEDRSKSFFLYDPECFHDPAGLFKARLALSLDVVFHLVEDDVFEKYMSDLFAAASEYVIIYSSNFDSPRSFHIKHRRFDQWVALNMPEWVLLRAIPNELAAETFSEFYIYAKRLAPTSPPSTT
jgi:hypothetical protein